MGPLSQPSLGIPPDPSPPDSRPALVPLPPSALAAGPTPPLSLPDYELLRRIGGGAYGEVWLARSTTGALRAVKIVWRRTFEEDRPFQREFEGIQRFERVSREHPSQLALFHVGRNEAAGCFYYVMELADAVGSPTAETRGRKEARTPASDPASSDANIRAPDLEFPSDSDPRSPGLYLPHTLRADLEHGRLPVERVLETALALTEALAHLHQHSLVHRDVKPSNIIFVNGKPKLADIGLVTDANDTCSIVGTEGYLPPEGPGTPQADLFALGKVLYEAATGLDRRDFPKLPEDLRTWPDRERILELNEVFLRTCAFDPKDRYRSAAELNGDLILLRAHESIREKRALQRRVRRMKRAAVAMAAVMALGAVPYGLAIREASLATALAKREHELRRRADHEAERARIAEADAKERLWGSYLARAQAGRWSHRAGRRFEAMQLLREAAAIRPSIELRNEAIACMALTDLHTLHEWGLVSPEGGADFDASYDRYVTADSLGIIHVRRVPDGAELAEFGGYAPPYACVTFSPDGRFLFVSCGPDYQRVEILDLERGEIHFRLPQLHFRCMDFSADGRFVAAAYELPDRDWPIFVFEVATKKQVAVFKHGSLPYHVRFHPKNSKWLLSSDQSPLVRVWDWEAGRAVKSFAHPKGVVGIDWHPDGHAVATGCADSKVRLWDAVTGEQRAEFAGHEWDAVWVGFSPDGKVLASRGWDSVLRVWDPCGKQELVHQSVSGFLYHFSRTSLKLGANAVGKRMQVLAVEPAHGYRLLRCDAPGGERTINCDFSPDGQWLVSAHENSVRLWDANTGTEVATLPQAPLHHAIAFHPDGTHLFVQDGNGVQDWLLKEGTSAASLTLQPARRFHLDDPTHVISLSTDGRTFAVPTRKAVHVFESATGEQRSQLALPDERVFCALSPDGLLAATWTGDDCANVEIWSVAQPRGVHSVPAHPGGIHAGFSPDNRWLAVGDPVEFCLWDIRSWRSVYRVPREPSDFYGWLAFSRDSRMLAVAISRSAVQLIEVASGRPLAALEAPDRLDIAWIRFNPEGTQLAVACGSGPIQLWDLRLVRQELASMNLDWELPPFPPARIAGTATTPTVTILSDPTHSTGTEMEPH